MAKKKEYYRLDRLDQLKDISYALLIGQRANGKSYAVKERVLQNAYNKDERFVYLRRYVLDIKQNAVTSYFDDAPVKEITKGNWERVVAFQGYLYWCKTDEKGKDVKSKNPIGRYCALNEDVRYKSQVFEKVTTIVFEEMIPNDSMYLDNEPTRLQQFASTVFRRNKGIVYLIGNTLSRVCPYSREWNIDFMKMKIGDINEYHFHVKDNSGNESIINVAVEYCGTTNYENKMFFGKASKQILSGEWEVTDAPKLPKPLKEFEQLYKVLVEYQAFKFVIMLLCDVDNGGLICFVYPETGIYNGFRILSDTFSTNPFISARLDNTKKPEQDISRCFALNKVCYSDNLTSADFIAVNKHFHIANMVDFE